MNSHPLSDLARALDDELAKRFDPNQKRDRLGRWTEMGSAGRAGLQSLGRAANVVAATFEHGGGTFDKKLRPAEFHSGYQVSTGDREKVIPKEELTPHKVRMFADKTPIGENEYVGTWIDGGNLYLEISEHIEDLGEALARAKERGQIAIWDFVHGEEILVEPQQASVETPEIEWPEKPTLEEVKEHAREFADSVHPPREAPFVPTNENPYEIHLDQKDFERIFENMGTMIFAGSQGEDVYPVEMPGMKQEWIDPTYPTNMSMASRQNDTFRDRIKLSPRAKELQDRLTAQGLDVDLSTDLPDSDDEIERSVAAVEYALKKFPQLRDPEKGNKAVFAHLGTHESPIPKLDELMYVGEIRDLIEPITKNQDVKGKLTQSWGLTGPVSAPFTDSPYQNQIRVMFEPDPRADWGYSMFPAETGNAYSDFNAYGRMMHEMGHAVQFATAGMSGGDRRVFTEVLQEKMEAAGFGYTADDSDPDYSEGSFVLDESATEVSGYAASSPMEFWAEIFSILNTNALDNYDEELQEKIKRLGDLMNEHYQRVAGVNIV